MGYSSSLPYPDVCLRSEVKQDGKEYYQYILTYVDYLLVVIFHPQEKFEGVNIKFKIKDDKYVPPSDYLEAELEKIMNANFTICWMKSSEKYVHASISCGSQ